MRSDSFFFFGWLLGGQQRYGRDIEAPVILNQSLLATEYGHGDEATTDAVFMQFCDYKAYNVVCEELGIDSWRSRHCYFFIEVCYHCARH